MVEMTHLELALIIAALIISIILIAVPFVLPWLSARLHYWRLERRMEATRWQGERHWMDRP